MHVIIIDGTLPEEPCEYCGKVADLRPYGKNGTRICYECGMLPENKATTDAMFNALLDDPFDTSKISAQ